MTDSDFLRQLREALEQRASELEAQSKRLADVTGYPAHELVVRPLAMAEAFGTVADAVALEDVGVILKQTRGDFLSEGEVFPKRAYGLNGHCGAHNVHELRGD